MARNDLRRSNRNTKMPDRFGFEGDVPDDESLSVQAATPDDVFHSSASNPSVVLPDGARCHRRDLETFDEMLKSLYGKNVHKVSEEQKKIHRENFKMEQCLWTLHRLPDGRSYFGPKGMKKVHLMKNDHVLCLYDGQEEMGEIISTTKKMAQIKILSCGAVVKRSKSKMTYYHTGNY